MEKNNVSKCISQKNSWFLVNIIIYYDSNEKTEDLSV